MWPALALLLLLLVGALVVQQTTLARIRNRQAHIERKLDLLLKAAGIAVLEPENRDDEVH